MATQNFYSDVGFAQSVSADAHTAGQNGSQLDTAGIESVSVVYDLSSYTDGTHELEVEHAEDDGNGSPDTWATADASDLLFDQSDGRVDTSGKVTFDASGDTGALQVGYIGDRRFVRVATTLSNITSGATYSANFVYDAVRHGPENAIDRG
jgi:hypothetical protein